MFDQSETNFAFFQAINTETRIFVYFLFEETKSLRLGRGAVNELKLNDTSISREHCEFSLRGNECYIRDLGSKFGSLVMVKGPVRLIQEQCLVVMVKQVMFSFRMTGKCMGCSKFFENKGKEPYSEINCFTELQENTVKAKLEENDSVCDLDSKAEIVRVRTAQEGNILRYLS